MYLSLSLQNEIPSPVVQVELKVNKMTSVHTQVPYDYYALKFCKPRSGVQQVS